MIYSQVARNGCAGCNLGRGTGRSVLISLTKSRHIHKSKRFRIIQQGVEYWNGIKYRHLVQIAMTALESFHVCCELAVVVCKRRCDGGDVFRTLFDELGGAIRRRDRQEKERARALLIEIFHLDRLNVINP